MTDFKTHMLVKRFYETTPKKSLLLYLIYFPAFFFWEGGGCFRQNLGRPWECVAHVNVIRHVCRGGKKVEIRWSIGPRYKSIPLEKLRQTANH
jgi:hypothetical protein